MNNYDACKAVAYAKKWAFSRNPDFYDFSGDELGGDCTNFVSQCLYAGCGVMNFTKIFGWYYLSLNNRTASWSGVQYLYNFLIDNLDAGPYGKEAIYNLAEKGDVIQLAFDDQPFFSHAMLVTEVKGYALSDILVAAHSEDSFNRPLSTYMFTDIRLIKILGARLE